MLEARELEQLMGETRNLIALCQRCLEIPLALFRAQEGLELTVNASNT